MSALHTLATIHSIEKTNTKRLQLVAIGTIGMLLNLKKSDGQELKSGNPKISRIGRQKRKNIFFLFSPKEPIWLTFFGNDIKRFDFLFLYSKFAKPENSATRAFNGGHEA